MSEKKQVHMWISSCSSGERTSRQVTAQMFVKGEAVYYRYVEPAPEMGNTATTVKIRRDEIKIIRHGEIRAEQTFARHAVRPGFYQFPQGRLPLTIRTRDMDIRLSDGAGKVTWSYDLDVDGQYSGTYELTLDIQGD